jgi:hypothetical protein
MKMAIDHNLRYFEYNKISKNTQIDFYGYKVFSIPKQNKKRKY